MNTTGGSFCKQSMQRGLVILQLFFICAWPGRFHDRHVVAQEQPDRLPGLLASMSQNHNGTTTTIRRVDLSMQHDWPTLDQLDERLSVASGPVEVVWEGMLDVKSSGQYELGILSSGQAQVTLDGKPCLETASSAILPVTSNSLQLSVGAHPIRIELKAAVESAGKFRLFWRGPAFQWEPISDRYLVHRVEDHAPDAFERGKLLTHGLRCLACHAPSVQPGNRLNHSIDPARFQPGPDLTALAGNLNRQWLVDWLMEKPISQPPANGDSSNPLPDDTVARRMPHFALSRQDAEDMAEALIAASLPINNGDQKSDKQSGQNSQNSTETAKSDSKSPKNVDSSKGDAKKTARSAPDASQGELVVLTRGCLACHKLSHIGLGERDQEDEATYLPHRRLEELTHNLFDGGDLSRIALKRPADFVSRWLSDPKQISQVHRMPKFDLEKLEREDVALFLNSLTATTASPDNRPTGPSNQANQDRGRRLLVEHRCANCHNLPARLQADGSQPESQLAIALSQESRWDTGCLGAEKQMNRPLYVLTAAQREQLRVYWQVLIAKSNQPNAPSSLDVPLLLAQSNCLACHARDAATGLTARAMQLVSVRESLATRLPALLPPSLNGVGDKLHTESLQASISRSEKPLRPWLDIRMPKYRLSDKQLESIAQYFVAVDRMPPTEAQREPLEDDVVTRAAAGRLVTAEGFGCQSCHQIGSKPPPTVALNARGTDLTMVGNRVRREWFNRWVRNPVRIIPRMEMPAIQIPVQGVMGNDLTRQIDAVWEMLNTPGFQPPSPAPVRIVRGLNQPRLPQHAQLLTDVLEAGDQKFLRPMIVGFENRHSLLFDLESGSLSKWWIGDTARELTRGKSWYWELGGQSLGTFNTLTQLSMIDRSGQAWKPTALEQFAVEFDRAEHTDAGLKWFGRIHLASDQSKRTVALRLHYEPTGRGNGPTGVAVDIQADLPDGHALALNLPAAPAVSANGNASIFNVQVDSQSVLSIGSQSAKTTLHSPTLCRSEYAQAGQPTTMHLKFETTWPVDQISEQLAMNTAVHEVASIEATDVAIVPGLQGKLLPLPRDEMPTALAWFEGQLVIGSLKGRVAIAIDSNQDLMPDQWLRISDDLPAPYGLATGPEGIDVLAKTGLMRLSRPEGPIHQSDKPWTMTTIADGWGYTSDYHDWAVGLPVDIEGNYYVALPCQQDDRSPSAARLRGTIQKLVPQAPTSDNPRRYRLETVAAGQRFPMGMAFDRKGRLFATDNQGNYNPFNELNHIQLGKRYGFINKLENKPGFRPELESPAVNLPHPWTRSVNGLCFLHTPKTAPPGKSFGPFEGHAIGCEYNGLSLIRMSLQEVDGVLQGAAYLFSRAPEGNETTFEGPIACAVSPGGDLFVGNIHDSGWGGGQNTGSIVQLTPTGQWVQGIREVQALTDGFLVQFTQPLDPTSATQIAKYNLRSYRRISTPAYGGNDQEERQEKILSVKMTPTGNAVQLVVGDLREDAVYQLNVDQFDGNEPLFPSEAHYTMKRVPK